MNILIWHEQAEDHMHLDDTKKYILFGTGDYYRRFRHWFIGKNVVAILDNDIKKQGSELDGWPVVSPESIAWLEYDAVIILSFYVTEMKKQLTWIGVPENKIYHFFDLHELALFEKEEEFPECREAKGILLLSHDLTLGGPALALYHAALTLKKAGYDVVYASMLDGELRSKLEESSIPVIIDKRLQICTMKELPWIKGFELIICNTINYNVFLSERDSEIPVIWWLHDSPFFYEGIKEERLLGIDTHNMKLLSVGPVPREAMAKYRSDVTIEDLIYGVSKNV